METKTFNKHELQDFIQSEQFNQYVNIPISRHRALSQIHNPRASDTDVLLVVQFDGNKVAGYLGILPDQLVHEGEIYKVGWLTCFWIDEAYKSYNIAANLFLRVIRAWEQKIFITNIVPWLGPIYQRTKMFLPTTYKSGLRGYRRSNLAEILPPKRKLFKKLWVVWRSADLLINLICDFRFLVFRGYPISHWNIEQENHVDPPAADFIARHNKTNWNQRGKTELEWILKYPWILEQERSDHDSSRYYFSSISRRFFYRTVKITGNDGTLQGFVLLCIRNNNLTIPYVFAEAACYDVIGKIVVKTMHELNLNMVTTFQDEMASSLRNLAFAFLYKKKIRKPYLISKKFSFIEALNFQDGDGDCAFY